MNSQPILVLSMHRSGSSALAGVLSKLGINIGGSLIPPAADNPKGFFENRNIVLIHDKLLNSLGSSWNGLNPLPKDWINSGAAKEAQENIIKEIKNEKFLESELWAVKDPRICRLLPLWQNIFKELALVPKYIICYRNPDEVAMSLLNRNRIDRIHSYNLWCNYMADMIRNLDNSLVSLVKFDDLLNNTNQVVKNIGKDLEISWPKCYDESEIDNFIDSGLRHNNSDSNIICDLNKTIMWIDNIINGIVIESLTKRRELENADWHCI